MDIEEFVNLKTELGSVSAFFERVNTDPNFRESVENLYFSVCGKRINKACSNCWHDAYMEIIYHSKNNSMEQRLFQLRAGAVLVDKENDKMYNQHNITDEFAIAYIKIHPDSLILFSVVPDNINELLGKVEEPPKKKK